ncbi:MAG TPA: hypothetical protein VF790_06080 [Dissulfurispiraceae bacterium]
MDKEKVHLSNLIDTESPSAVYEEVTTIIRMMQPHFDYYALDKIFQDVVRLYKGIYPGYRKCNTEYHDLRHTTDILLAMMRLMHGASMEGVSFSGEDIERGLISALMHDTGYIQASGDTIGTGAKYTLVHVKRSVSFMERYLNIIGYGREDCQVCRELILCTSNDAALSEMHFSTPEAERLGKLLATADIIGQMADRTYLEQLLFLFREFSEAHIMRYKNEVELLEKTLQFYEVTRQRFAADLQGMDRYALPHFKAKWGLERDLYREAIERNIKYLTFILRNHEKDYLNTLKRGGIVKKIRESCA